MAEIPPESDDAAFRYSRAELNEVVADRAVVEQAKGVVMQLHGVDAYRAFTMLRARARMNRVMVRKLSEQVVANPTMARDF